MDAKTIASLLKPMNSSQIISTLNSFEKSGLNVSQIDIPTVLSSLNVTQVEGLLSSNSSTVDGLLKSLSSIQLVTVLNNFQNVTSTLFKTGSSLNSSNPTLAKEYIGQGKTLLSLFLNKINNVFTTRQLLGVFSILSNGAAIGTGSKKLMNIAKDLMNGFTGGVNGDGSLSIGVPKRLLNLVEAYQHAEFGDYPTTKDIAPSSIFMSIFFIFALIHLGIFMKNYSLGHKFFISLGLSIYSLIRTLGFLLRIVWAKDVSKITIGLVSMIFIILPTVFLPGLNLILAQRLFTWRHPKLGSKKIFMSLMYLIYSIVIAVVVMTIIAACIQVNYFLSEDHFKMTKQVIQASSILILIYSLLAVILIGAAYIIKPTKSDDEIITYQPFWIKSFGLTYFVPKGSAIKNSNTVPISQRDAIRVIHSTQYHYDTTTTTTTTTTTEDEESNNKSLKQNYSIVIIAISTLLVFIGDIFRCVSTFIDQYKFEQSWIFKPVVMYIMFGVLETFVNLLYIFGRIDLRFYKPDSLKKDVGKTAIDNDDEESKQDSNEQEADEKLSESNTN